VDDNSTPGGEALVWVAAGLGAFALVLAGFAVYLVIRHQGFFYRANVRSTHHAEAED
jgi:hypothetical protein